MFEKKIFENPKFFLVVVPFDVKITYLDKWTPHPKVKSKNTSEQKNIGPEKVFKPVSRGVFFRR